ncbi:MAG: hypothetical protein ACKO9Q_09025 [Pirellula sp.]
MAVDHGNLSWLVDGIQVDFHRSKFVDALCIEASRRGKSPWQYNQSQGYHRHQGRNSSPIPRTVQVEFQEAYSLG